MDPPRFFLNSTQSGARPAGGSPLSPVSEQAIHLPSTACVHTL